MLTDRYKVTPTHFQHGLAPSHVPPADGHNRYEICAQLKVDFKTKAIKAKDRGEAINWIIAKQLGRRNLTDEQKSYLRGKRYETENVGSARPKGADQNGQHGNTRSRLAKEYGIGEGTIQRDTAFAKAVDSVAETHGEPKKQEILSGASGLTRQQVVSGDLTPKPSTIRSAKRALRAKEKAYNGKPCSAAIAKEPVSAIATDSQPKLAALCQSVKDIAAIVGGIAGKADRFVAIKETEHWTPHARTRLRANLAGIKRDLSYLDHVFK